MCHSMWLMLQLYQACVVQLGNAHLRCGESVPSEMLLGKQGLLRNFSVSEDCGPQAVSAGFHLDIRSAIIANARRLAAAGSWRLDPVKR